MTHLTHVMHLPRVSGRHICIHTLTSMCTFKLVQICTVDYLVLKSNFRLQVCAYMHALHSRLRTYKNNQHPVDFYPRTITYKIALKVKFPNSESNGQLVDVYSRGNNPDIESSTWVSFHLRPMPWGCSKQKRPFYESLLSGWMLQCQTETGKRESCRNTQ